MGVVCRKFRGVGRWICPEIPHSFGCVRVPKRPTGSCYLADPADPPSPLVKVRHHAILLASPHFRGADFSPNPRL